MIIIRFWLFCIEWHHRDASHIFQIDETEFTFDIFIVIVFRIQTYFKVNIQLYTINNSLLILLQIYCMTGRIAVVYDYVHLLK